MCHTEFRFVAFVHQELEQREKFELDGSARREHGHATVHVPVRGIQNLSASPAPRAANPLTVCLANPQTPQILQHMAKIEDVSSEPQTNDQHQGGVISEVLKPGSSLHPTFLLIVDAAFIFLAFVLFALFFLSGLSLHVLFLMIIEGFLWGSVKWWVSLCVSCGLSA